MNERDALWQIDATLKRLSFREVGPGIADYEGPIKVHGKAVDIILSIADVRLSTKPKAYLKDRSQVPLETLAHIETDEGICYAAGPGLPVDMYQPGQAVLRVLEEVRRTLELSYAGRASQEIVDEYQSYWRFKLAVRVFLPRKSDHASIKCSLFFASANGNVEFMGLAEKPKLRSYQVEYPSPAELWYVNHPIGPAAGFRVPETLAQAEQWLQSQRAFHGKDVRRAALLIASGEPLFVAAPNALIGLRAQVPKELKAAVTRGAIRPQSLPGLIQAKAASIALDRFSGSWCGINEVTSRNMAGEKTLGSVSIALIGCGTIGSHLARMLVQSGAGSSERLSLYDPDILSEGNIGRHLLGFGDIGKPKAERVKAELERFHPDLRVLSFNTNAVRDWAGVAMHDLVIDATGEWNVQSALNDLFMNSTGKPHALLHSWVFMNGAGVQSFMNLRDEFACFRCLKPIFDQGWRYPAGNEAETLDLRPATCGDGSYIPFSVDVTLMAASLAARAALDWVNGRPGQRLRTVAVDPERGRYQKPVSPKPSAQCPACKHFRT